MFQHVEKILGNILLVKIFVLILLVCEFTNLKNVENWQKFKNANSFAHPRISFFYALLLKSCQLQKIYHMIFEIFTEKCEAKS